MDDRPEEPAGEGSGPEPGPFAVRSLDGAVLEAASQRVGLPDPALATEGVAVYVQLLDEHAAVVLRART